MPDEQPPCHLPATRRGIHRVLATDPLRPSVARGPMVSFPRDLEWSLEESTPERAPRAGESGSSVGRSDGEEATTVTEDIVIPVRVGTEPSLRIATLRAFVRAAFAVCDI